MNPQTEEEKWQELGKILGLEMLSAGSTKAVFQVSGKGIHVGYDVDFRDRILDAITAAKQRTPLELAAYKMAQMMTDELGKENCICRFAPLVSGPVPCSTCRKRAILKKAGVIK